MERLEELPEEDVPKMYNNKGIALYGMGEYVEGVQYYQRAIDSYKKSGNDTLYAEALMNLGMAYKEIGADSLATNILYESIDIFRLLELSEDEASAMSALGNVYRHISDYNRSEYFHKKALLLRRQAGDSPSVAYSLHNLGMHYRTVGKVTLAKDHFFQALELKEKFGLSKSIASTCAQLGQLYMESGNCDSAFFYLNRSIEIRKNTDKPNSFNLALNNYHMGKLELECGDKRKGVECLLLAKTSMESRNSGRDLLHVYEELIRGYTELESHEEALAISMKLIQLKEEILGENSRKELARLAIQYDVEGYQRELELQEIENNYLKDRNRILLIFSIILFVLLVFIVLLLRLNMKGKKKIEVQNEALVFKNNNIIHLHEELGHRTNNFFSLLRGMILADKSTENQEAYHTLLSRIDAMTEVQRHLIIGQDSSVSSVDLLSYLQQLIEHSRVLYTRDNSVEISEDFSDIKDVVVDYQVAARLGIVLNELINNSVKHNDLSKNKLRISVKGSYRTDGMQLEYSDSGNANGQDSTDGKGLHLINQLLQPIGGKAQFSLSDGFKAQLQIEIEEGDPTGTSDHLKVL